MTSQEVPQPAIESLEDVDRAMVRLRRIKKKYARREAAFKATNERRQQRFDERSAPDAAEEAAIIQALRHFLAPSRTELIREHGKTIERSQGTVAWRNSSEVIDLPKNLEEVIAVLQSRDDGPQALEQTWKVSKSAITGMSDETKDALRSAGAAIGKHETLTVKPKGLDKPIQVDSRDLPSSEA